MTLIFPMKSENSSFVERVYELSGQNVYKCYHCGKCSAGCPLSHLMDIMPNQVIRKVQLGDESVLDSKAIWFCVSCFTCTVRCPQGIDLAKVMEALRQLVLRKNGDNFDVSKMSEEELAEIPQIALVATMRKRSS